MVGLFESGNIFLLYYFLLVELYELLTDEQKQGPANKFAVVPKHLLEVGLFCIGQIAKLNASISVYV